MNGLFLLSFTIFVEICIHKIEELYRKLDILYRKIYVKEWSKIPEINKILWFQASCITNFLKSSVNSDYIPNFSSEIKKILCLYAFITTDPPFLYQWTISIEYASYPILHITRGATVGSFKYFWLKENRK